jgi:predicted nucleotidyltransferase
MDQKKNLQDTFVEEYESALLLQKAGKKKATTILLSKALFALVDFIIYTKYTKLSKNHGERFRILEQKEKELYNKVDSVWSKYTDTYSKPSTEEAIFGSFVKEKMSPSDIDVAVLGTNLHQQDIKKLIRKKSHEKVDIQFFTMESYASFLWVTLIREGYSVKHNKYLHQIYGIRPVTLFKYSLKELTPSKKVMFERAIKTIKGITKLSNRVVLVPINQGDEFSDFLRYWNIDIDASEYGLLPLVRKEEF